MRKFTGSDTSLVRSHSLKRTILDWGSKFCIDDAILALLGRHSKCVKGSVPVYAREESLRAVKAIEPMLRAIADGSFKPDASRANYFPKNLCHLQCCRRFRGSEHRGPSDQGGGHRGFG